MSVLAIAGLVVVGFLALVLILAAMKPSKFKYERSTTMSASADKIAPLVNNFHEWARWSPWEKLDTDLKRGYSGAVSGTGAAYTWDGKKTGAGRMEIINAQSSGTDIQLDFERPFKAHNITKFRFQPTGASTRVVWTMEGQNVFMGKVIGVFMSMDTLIGKDFEAGLASMKLIAEQL